MFFGKAVYIMGPTCVGKSNLSFNLLDILPFEIISVDSSMVYKYMDIGTSKPSNFLLNKYRHHLINVRNPKDFYSVFNFCYDSYFIVHSCWKRNKIPLFIGGSIMYYWFLKFFLNFSFLKIAIIPIDKYNLYSKIKKRLSFMFKMGFVEEVFFLHYVKKMDISKYKSLYSIGYKELFMYLNGILSFSEAKELILKNTNILANRQLFWIKKFKNDIYLYDISFKKSFLNILNLINRYLY